MRKIALAAVALVLFLTGSSLHMASAQATQHSKDKPSQTIASNVKTAAQPVQPAAPAAVPGPVVVTVVHGDTLSGIATANATTYMRLYDANDFINNPNLIFPGQQITVPAEDAQLADRAVATPAAPAPQAAAPAPAPAPAAAPAAPTTVTVHSGDTLSSIASANGTTAARLFDANTGLSDPNVLHVGQQLTIPSADEQLASRTPAVATPAPAAAPAPKAAPAPVSKPATTSYPAVTDNAAKAYIYAHESSNNPNATNYLGCYGLGQDCNGQVRDLCGADYACQDEFFTNYAMRRYGSWAAAEAFWQAHHWW